MIGMQLEYRQSILYDVKAVGVLQTENEGEASLHRWQNLQFMLNSQGQEIRVN